MRSRTRVRLVVGTFLIAGIIAGLWAVYRPTVSGVVKVKPPPPPPRLHHARAVVLLALARTGRPRRAVIGCDGDRRTASGFWAGEALRACDALASTRTALLTGPACGAARTAYPRMRAVGAFEGRRFDRRAQQVGCADPDAWLGVDALASPILTPQRRADRARNG
jgi:hypothetical protein